MAFTCPRCGRTSQHPEDARQGYCGACHDWTALDTEYRCGACGVQVLVPPSHVGSVWCTCGSPEPRYPVPVSRVMNSRGLWQYDVQAAPASPASGPPDLDAAVRYIGEVYSQWVPVPAVDHISGSMDRYRNGLMSLAELRLEVSGHLDQAMADFITGLQRNTATDSGDCPAPPAAVELEADEIPWANPMRWYPVDGE